MGSSITVIVPAFNEERNLAAAVETVREATADRVSALEIIIVDDNSTDRTGPIADQLASEDGRRAVYRDSPCTISIRRRGKITVPANGISILC